MFVPLLLGDVCSSVWGDSEGTHTHAHEDAAPGKAWTKLFVLFFQVVPYLDFFFLGENWREVTQFRIGLQKDSFRVEATPQAGSVLKDLGFVLSKETSDGHASLF